MPAINSQRWRFTGSNAVESLERLAVMVIGVVLMKSGTNCIGHVTDAVQAVQGWTHANPEASNIVAAAVAFISREWFRKEDPSCAPTSAPASEEMTPQQIAAAFPEAFAQWVSSLKPSDSPAPSEPS